jgi:hypothetical protein
VAGPPVPLNAEEGTLHLVSCGYSRCRGESPPPGGWVGSRCRCARRWRGGRGRRIPRVARRYSALAGSGTNCVLGGGRGGRLAASTQAYL